MSTKKRNIIAVKDVTGNRVIYLDVDKIESMEKFNSGMSINYFITYVDRRINVSKEVYDEVMKVWWL